MSINSALRILLDKLQKIPNPTPSIKASFKLIKELSKMM